jgi:catecholate siderophore receptor
MKTYTKPLKMLPFKLMGCGVLILTINPVSSLAQDMEAAAENEVYELDEFVVTDQFLFSDQVNALKTPTPVIDVPQSLSITSATDIELRGFDSIGDIVDYTPGVNMNQGEGHRDAVVFRGIRSTSDFFVDGVRDDVQYYRSLYNIEQVEILRGPNALLFGRGGAGGVLNRVTKKAEISQNFNAYSLSNNSFGATKVYIDSNLAINETSAFRINAYGDTFENHRDYSDGQGYGINPSLKFALSDQTTLDLSVEVIDYDRSIDRGIPGGADGKPMDSLNDVVFGDPDLNKSEFESFSFRALLQHTFSDTLKGIFTASYTDYDKLYQNVYASAYNEATNIATLDGYVDTTERQNFVLSGNLVAEFETGDIKHTLLFGSEFIDSDSENDRFTDNWAAGPGFSVNPREFNANGPFTVDGFGIAADGDISRLTFTTFNDDTDTDLTVYSFYLQDEIELTDQLTLVLGARFDSFDIDVTEYNAAGAETNDSGSQKDEEFTPRAGLVYKPKENISLYASYSQTFVPTSGDQFADLGTRGLDPDEFTNLEAGVKWDLAVDQSVTLAIFKIEQDYVEGVAGNSRVEESEVEGFEAQYLGRISDRWTVSAGYTYLTGENATDTVGNDRPGELPKSSFSIWNSYQLTKKLGLGLGAIYQDESTPVGGDRFGTVPDFIRVDAAAYYQISENLRLQVNIENLLDEEYYPHAYDDHQFTVGAPINATVSISGTF